MINKISCRLTDLFMKNTENAEDRQYREVYQYVLFLILNYLFFFGYSFIIGALLGVPFQSIVFFISIAFLRRYAGGYHASTENRCLIISSLYFLTGIILIKLMNFYIDRINFNIILSASVICSLIILFLCPCDCPSKPVKKEKINSLRLKCIALILIMYTVCFILFRLKIMLYISPFFSSVSIETALMIAGKIKIQTGLSH